MSVRNWASLLALIIPMAAHGQSFPKKPILVVLPQAPGTIDVTMRLIQPHLVEDLGQPIVIENRPGATGFIGTAFVARAAPDGHTLVALSSNTLVTAAVISKKAPFDPLKDFTPVTVFAEPVNVVAVKAALPVHSMKDLIEHAKRNPGKLFYGSSGLGSVQHLDGEMIKQAAGIPVGDIVHVPYKGLGLVAQALMSGEIDIAFITYGTLQPAVSTGKFRVLANYSGRSHPSVSTVPDIRDVLPSFQKIPSWTGILGPAGMPKAVLARLHASTVKALNRPEVRAKLESNSTVIANGPEEFMAVIKTGLDQTANLQRTLGIQLEQ
jgi:tripartite-type tricarboxylate transporter receptor subunit TctC